MNSVSLQQKTVQRFQSLLPGVAILLLSLLLNCSSGPELYHQHPLASERLIPRPNHPGKLTNQTCTAYDQSGNCISWNLIEYDLADPNFQAEANKFNITCRIAGKRYKICMNEKDAKGKPMIGYCRFSFKKDCILFFCKDPKRSVDFFPADPHQNVLDSGVRCQNEDIYPVRED